MQGAAPRCARPGGHPRPPGGSSRSARRLLWPQQRARSRKRVASIGHVRVVRAGRALPRDSDHAVPFGDPAAGAYASAVGLPNRLQPLFSAPSRAGDRLPCCAGIGGSPGEEHGGGAVGDAGMAGCAPGHACGDGGHRRVWVAGLARPGGGFRADAAQRAARQERGVGPSTAPPVGCGCRTVQFGRV